MYNALPFLCAHKSRTSAVPPARSHDLALDRARSLLAGRSRPWQAGVNPFPACAATALCVYWHAMYWHAMASTWKLALVKQAFWQYDWLISLPVLRHQRQGQSQRCRERTGGGEGEYACDERSKTEGIKQHAGHCHEWNATARSPEPPHTRPTLPTGM
eukprot:75816-Chlamydomonas_euryale.AAC.3